MSSWTAFYVHSPVSTEATLARLLEELGALRKSVRGKLTLRAHPSAPWVEVECGLSAIEGELPKELSRRLELGVVGICIQTTASVFFFRRFEAGVERRALSYADGSWLFVRGSPEPWEADILFSDEQLSYALENADSEAEENGYRQTFRERRIEPGEYWPCPDEWDCMYAALGLDRRAFEAFRESAASAVVKPLHFWQRFG